MIKIFQVILTVENTAQMTDRHHYKNHFCLDSEDLN